MKTIQNQILDYNNDYNVQLLRAKYNRPTFFELMAKGRSETVHSSFLSWLLQGDDLNQQGSNAPIISFLGMLVRRDAQQNNLIPTILKKAIITRSLKVDNVKTECESPVKKLAYKKYCNQKEENILKIASKSQDRIDLVIDCDITPVGNYRKLQIIIENKVQSVDGSSKKESKTGYEEYDSADQTTRYFMAAKVDDGVTCQIFVYLTPLASQELENYFALSSSQRCGNCDEYIQINYQDVADRVITPLLWSENISDRVRLLLEEYIETLTIPTLSNVDGENINDIKKMLVMASKEEDREQLLNFLNTYKDLICNAVLIANPSIEVEEYGNCERIIREYIAKITAAAKSELQKSLGGEISSVNKYIQIKSRKVKIDEFCGSSQLYSQLKQTPDQETLLTIVKETTKKWENTANELTQEKLNELFGSGVVRIGGRKTRIITYKYLDDNAVEKTVNYQIAEIVRQKKSTVIVLSPVITWEEFFRNEYVYDLALLYDFYQQNSRLIVAAMKILVESSNVSDSLTLWQDLYDGLTTNTDHTKYKVTVNGNSSEALNKREVVKFIIENIDLTDELITALNIKLPRMFLQFEKSQKQEFDRSRYEGLEGPNANNQYSCRPLKDGKEFSLYVSNQWGILPLDSEQSLELHPSGKGGNFGRLLDFFLTEEKYGVKIEAENTLDE